jgi:hypothetical protein
LSDRRAQGFYAQTTAAFIRWLAAHLDDARAEFERLRSEARSQFRHEHARTADIRAQLTAAWSIFIAFLGEVGAIEAGQAARLRARVGAALEEAANAQAQFSANAEPTDAFIRLLTSAIAAGRAHLADAHGARQRGARQRAVGASAQSARANINARNGKPKATASAGSLVSAST